ERLIADLFAYTRSEYLDQTLQRQSLDLVELLNKIVDGRRREAERKRVELQVDGLRHGCMVEGDPQLLERAVENLLDNALRYAPDGGAIGLRWRVNGSRTEFSVFDTGPGIAAHDLAHLFEPMYRADVSRSRETGGRGLGLAIARRILRAHGGDLVAANRETGGAEFTGSLPLGPHVPGGPAPVLSGSRDYPRT
ncbi:MAG: sensor histidine kinase, partial [Chloroflexota bacterium]